MCSVVHLCCVMNVARLLSGQQHDTRQLRLAVAHQIALERVQPCLDTRDARHRMLGRESHPRAIIIITTTTTIGTSIVRRK